MLFSSVGFEGCVWGLRGCFDWGFLMVKIEGCRKEYRDGDEEKCLSEGKIRLLHIVRPAIQGPRIKRHSYNNPELLVTFKSARVFE